MTLAHRFARLPTTAKFLLILTAVLLPIGIALTWLGEIGIRQANVALEGRTEDQARTSAGAIEGLIARNALARGQRAVVCNAQAARFRLRAHDIRSLSRPIMRW